MAKARAQIEITASSNKLAQGLASADRQFRSWSSAIARRTSTAFKGITKGLAPGEIGKNALGHFGGDLMGRGMDAVIGAARDVHDFERSLTRLQIAMDGNEATTAKLRTEFRAISKETGVAAADVLAGAQAYVGFTGDAAGAAAAAKLFADVSAATGSSVTDVAQAMAALKTSMGITAKEGEAAFSALIVQGKGGAVEIKDMAGELAALAPQFALFKGGKGLDGLREMGAGFQVIMKNAATSGDAATKFRALMSSLGDPRTLKELKKVGIQVYDNNGKMKGASEIFEALAKSKKLATQQDISRVFGREEARSAVLALREHIGTYRELREAAEDTGAVQRDKMTFLESSAGKIDKAFNTMKVSLAEAFTTERIEMFAQALGKAAEYFAKIVGYADALAGGWEKFVEYRDQQVGRSKAEALLAGERVALFDKDAHIPKMYRRSAARGPEFIKGGSKRLSLIEKDKLAREYLQKYSNLELRGHEGGAMGRAQDQEKEMYRIAGERLREEARRGDAWFSTAKVDPAAVEGLKIDRITQAIRAGFAGLTLPTASPTVQIGDNQVARSVDKSTAARRRPQ